MRLIKVDAGCYLLTGPISHWAAIRHLIQHPFKYDKEPNVIFILPLNQEELISLEFRKIEHGYALEENHLRQLIISMDRMIISNFMNGIESLFKQSKFEIGKKERIKIYLDYRFHYGSVDLILELDNTWGICEPQNF